MTAEKEGHKLMRAQREYRKRKLVREHAWGLPIIGRKNPRGTVPGKTAR